MPYGVCIIHIPTRQISSSTVGGRGMVRELTKGHVEACQAVLTAPSPINSLLRTCFVIAHLPITPAQYNIYTTYIRPCTCVIRIALLSLGGRGVCLLGRMPSNTRQNRPSRPPRPPPITLQHVATTSLLCYPEFYDDPLLLYLLTYAG